MRHTALIAALLLIFGSQAQSNPGPGQDKVYHAIAGASISLGSYYTAHALLGHLPDKERKEKSLRISLLTTMAVAVGKEILDVSLHKARGTYDDKTIPDSIGDAVITIMSGAMITFVFTF